jgi:hypothetical protein
MNVYVTDTCAQNSKSLLTSVTHLWSYEYPEGIGLLETFGDKVGSNEPINCKEDLILITFKFSNLIMKHFIDFA